MFTSSLIATTGVGIAAGAPVQAGLEDVEGTVFHDVDFNGDKVGDAGQAGIEITATDVDGTSVSTMSGIDGSYSLDVSSLDTPVDMVVSVPGALSHLGLGPFGPDMVSSRVVASPGDIDVDFGVITIEHRIGNLVWFDTNDDAATDLNEHPAAGVTVQLFGESGDVAGFDATDALLAQTITDSTGNYWFDQVLEGRTHYVALPGDQSANAIVIDGVTVDPATILSSSGFNLSPKVIDNVDDGDAAEGFMSVSGPIDVYGGTALLDEVDANSLIAAEPYLDSVGAGLTDDADSNLSVDLGLIQQSRIGNLLWLDGVVGEVGFNDGVAAPSEAAGGIGGAEVHLYRDHAAAGVPGEFDVGVDTYLAAATTTSSGEYWFDELVPGGYFVAVPAGQSNQLVDGITVDLGDLVSSTAASSRSDDRDHGDPVDGFVAVSSVIDVDSGASPTDELGDFGDPGENGQESTANGAGQGYVDAASDLTIDFGFVVAPRYGLGNLIWFDADDSGTADRDEPGIDGVEVELWSAGGAAPLAATTTADGGQYLFEDLTAGDYAIVIPAGQAGQMVGSDAVDLDDLIVARIGATDPDAAGDRDNDSNGFSSGTDIRSGVISIGEVDPFVPDEPVDEMRRSDDPVDDDPGPGDAQRNFTLDIGFVQPLRVGNLVWFDGGGGSPGDPGYIEADEDDGQADARETGVAGVLVQLLGSDGDVVAETVSDANGNYWIDDLNGGTFQVGVPIDQQPTLGALDGIIDGATDAMRSSTGQSTAVGAADDDDDGAPAIGYLSVSRQFELVHGAESQDEGGDFADDTAGAAEAAANEAGRFRLDDHSNLEVDLGLAPVPTYRIGNLVWADADDDGIAEAGELGLAGVLVQLLDDDSRVVAEMVTNADGSYAFDGLLAGEYRVRVPANQMPELLPLVGIDPDVLDGLATSGRPATDPDPGGVDTDNDNDGVASLVGYTSGILDLGEGDGHSEVTGETNRDGVTSDEDGLVRDGRSNLAVDIGFAPGLELGNQIFLDALNDGDDRGDAAAPSGIVVDLYAADGEQLQTTVTDASGRYLFTGVPAGDYVVELPSSNFVIGGPLAGAHPSTGAAVSLDPDDGVDGNSDGVGQADRSVRSGVLTLVRGDEPTDEVDAAAAVDNTDSNLTIDFGVYALGFGGVITKADGSSGGRGVPASGVAMSLLDIDLEPVLHAGDAANVSSTDDDGNYRFAGLGEGEYYVEVDASNFGTDGALAGAGSPGESVVMGPVSVVAGIETQPLTFGPGAGAEVGDMVWFDLDRDGVQGATEVGLSGVRLELVDSAGAVVATEVSGPDGAYGFTGLAAGEYSIRMMSGTVPSGARPSPTGAGTAATDNDIDPTTWSTAVFTLNAGQSDLTLDIGVSSFSRLPSTGPASIAALVRWALGLSLLGVGFIMMSRRATRQRDPAG